MVALSDQVMQELAATVAFFEVVLAKRTGPLNETQREILADTLTHLQRAAARLQSAWGDGVDPLDESIVSNHAPGPQVAGFQPIALTFPHDADER